MTRTRYLAFGVVGLVAVIAVALALFQQLTPTSATGGPELMTMQVSGTFNGADVECDSSGGTLESPEVCELDKGSTFTLDIVADTPPDAGYIGWQTQVFYSNLVYKAVDLADENMWPESVLAVRSPASPTGKEGTVGHGDVSGVVPPFPVSDHEGVLVSLGFNCAWNDQPEGAHSSLVYLRGWGKTANPAGSVYVDPDEDTFPSKIIGQADLDLDLDPETAAQTVDVSGVLDIRCSPPPTPTPSPTPCPPGKVPIDGGCGTPTPTPEATNTPTATEPPPNVCGDANGSGEVSSLDSLEILQFTAGFLDEVSLEKVADLNDDDAITSVDAALILQFEAGFIDDLTC